MAAAAVHLTAVRWSTAGLAAFAKLTASTAFVSLAALAGAAHFTFGRLILAALVLSWIGDALLLWERDNLFVAGVGAFMLAHVSYAAAFMLTPIGLAPLAVSLALMTFVGLTLFRWLRQGLGGIFLVAVPVYIAVIMLMVSLAVSASIAGSSGMIAAGAIVFAASDVLVARERFVRHGFVNKLFGIPLYYIAQLLLAGSVAAAQH